MTEASGAGNAQMQRKRIWGWMFFDWASQPYHTLGITFIFGPFFAAVATSYFLSQGLMTGDAKAQAQSLWALGQTGAGLFVAFFAPLLGALVDRKRRRRPFIALFSVLYVLLCWSLWDFQADDHRLLLFLGLFFCGFAAVEILLVLTNAYLPSLGPDQDIGRISGTGYAFGYWGGLASLILFLVFFGEMGESGRTIAGLKPAFGLLGADAREGTRSVGPISAVWYIIFMIPFFLWVKDDASPSAPKASLTDGFKQLISTLKGLKIQRSTGAYLLSSMLYRDATNALHAFGGVYATLVLDWNITTLGIFGVLSVTSAAIFTYIGGRFDHKFGPKPVIIGCILVLLLVCLTVICVSREAAFGLTLSDGSIVPDIAFFICGSVLGGAGGALNSASRSMMVRHAHPDRPTEAFGLFALSGKATAFLAPMLIGLFTYWTRDVQLGFLPVIMLYCAGLICLKWVHKDGEDYV